MERSQTSKMFTESIFDLTKQNDSWTIYWKSECSREIEDDEDCGEFTKTNLNKAGQSTSASILTSIWCIMGSRWTQTPRWTSIINRAESPPQILDHQIWSEGVSHSQNSHHQMIESLHQVAAFAIPLRPCQNLLANFFKDQPWEDRRKGEQRTRIQAQSSS